MTIHLGKGTMTVTTPDGREDQYEVVNFRFDPVKPNDMVALDIETHVDHPGWSNLNGTTDLFAGIDTAADRLSIAVFEGRMRIVDMQKELFREFVVKPFIDDFRPQIEVLKVALSQPPKKKKKKKTNRTTVSSRRGGSGNVERNQAVPVLRKHLCSRRTEFLKLVCHM